MLSFKFTLYGIQTKSFLILHFKGFNKTDYHFWKVKSSFNKVKPKENFTVAIWIHSKLEKMMLLYSIQDLLSKMFATNQKRAKNFKMKKVISKMNFIKNWLWWKSYVSKYILKLIYYNLCHY